jgi:hypothetical protein
LWTSSLLDDTPLTQAVLAVDGLAEAVLYNTWDLWRLEADLADFLLQSCNVHRLLHLIFLLHMLLLFVNHFDIMVIKSDLLLARWWVD